MGVTILAHLLFTLKAKFRVFSSGYPVDMVTFNLSRKWLHVYILFING